MIITIEKHFSVRLPVFFMFLEASVIRAAKCKLRNTNKVFISMFSLPVYVKMNL